MCDMFLMLKTVYTLFSYKQNFYKQHQAEIDKNQANAKQRDWNFAVSKLFTFFIHVKNKCVCIHEIVRLIIMKMKILLLLFTFNPYIYYIYINLNNSSYLLAYCLLYFFQVLFVFFLIVLRFPSKNRITIFPASFAFSFALWIIINIYQRGLFKTWPNICTGTF